MKTNPNLTNNKGSIKIIVTLIGKQTAFIATVFLLLPFCIYSQNSPNIYRKTYIGTSFYGQVSANGYGSSYSLMPFIKTGRRSLFAGPVIGKRKFQLSGFQANYTYSLTGPDAPGYIEGMPELFVFVNGAYHFNARLGKRTLQEEDCANPFSKELDAASMRFRSIEVYGGVGLRIRFANHFKWVNAVGLGGYHTFDFPEKQGLFYSQRNAGLVLRTGIMYEFH